METLVDAATTAVEIVKDVLVAPAATVTLAGTVATPVLLLDRLITAPPLGAGALRVTVPVEDCEPPTTLAGFTVRVERVAVGGGGGGGGVVVDAPSKVQTDGFGSFKGTTTNFEGEIM